MEVHKIKKTHLNSANDTWMKHSCGHDPRLANRHAIELEDCTNIDICSIA